MLVLNILASLLLGSSLSVVLSKFLVNKTTLSFYTSEFSKEIIGVSERLATAKTFDIVEFLVFILLSFLIFAVNLFVSKKGRVENQSLAAIYAIVSFLIFLQSHFVHHSGKLVIFQVVFLQLFFVIFARKKVSFQEPNLKQAANGLFLGFYLLIFTKLWTTSFVIPFSLFLALPVVYSVLKKPPKILRNPAHLVFILAAFFPFDKILLLFLFFAFLGAVLFFVKYEKVGIQKKIYRIYPYAVLFVFIYNPMFFIGTLDSLEEGFWLAWSKRLLDGETLYKDFHAYHPPLISWGLANFLRLTQESVYQARLYFHILQILGTFIIYACVDRLVKNKILKILTLILILSFLTRNLLNNVEIRLGLGLLAVIQTMLFVKIEKRKYLLFSGAASAISFFVSTEVGIASFLSIFVSLVFVSFYQRNKILTILKNYLLGVFIILLPVLLVLSLNNSLREYFFDMQYVLSLFANGYSNAAIERAELSNLLHWRDVDSYFSSTAFFWQFARMGMVASIMLIFYKMINRKINKVDVYALTLVVFTLFLTRTALGRSDKHHLLTFLVPSVILVSYFLQNFTSKARHVGVFVVLLFLFYFARQEMNSNFLHDNIVKFQTFGSVPGRYPDYKLERMKILAHPGADTEKETELIEHIKDNTEKDETIFVFPQKPEVYFLADRKNATSYDTPIIYITKEHQQKMVQELAKNRPRLIIYGPHVGYYDLTVESLPLVNNYILENYEEKEIFDKWRVLIEAEQKSP